MVCEQISTCRDCKICYKKKDPNTGRKNVKTEKEMI